VNGPLPGSIIAGLLWLLNGDRLAELDCHRAVIERRTGSLQVFPRRPLAAGESGANLGAGCALAKLFNRY
jgi:hypothetical protein